MSDSPVSFISNGRRKRSNYLRLHLFYKLIHRLFIDSSLKIFDMTTDDFDRENDGKLCMVTI
jgi:hypothetical protein